MFEWKTKQKDKSEVPNKLRNTSERKTFFFGKNLSIAIPICLCCILIITNLVQYFHFYKVSDAVYEICKKVSDAESMESLIAYANNLETSSLLNTGLTIISIAVTIWIGLNIYNVVNKEDIEEALKEYDRRIIDLDKEREKRLQFFSKKTEFINLLYITGKRYCASNFFANLFWNTKEEYSNIDKVIKCERKYIQCCSFYENNERKKANKLARDLVDEYIDLKSEPPYTTSNESDPMKNFIRMRLSDALFYKNMTVDRGDEFDLKEVKKSIQYYQEIIENPSEIRKWDDEILAYFFNTQGYLMHQMCKHMSSEMEKKHNKYENKALQKLEKAVLKAPYKGRYKRNLGLIYQNKNNYEKARETYKEAMQKDPLDYKAYNTIVALDLKKIDQETGIQGRKSTLLNEMDFSDDKTQKWLDKIKEDIALCRSAERIDFSFVDTHYNMAKAYLYRYLWEGKNNPDLLQEAHEQIKIAKSLDSQSLGALFIERNIYEAEGKLEDAFKCAESGLLGDKGDNKDLKEIYDERINKKKCKESV